jgi:hypothetical protein
MPLYTIILIYEVLATNQYEATDELAQARELHQEKIYLVKTIIRKPGEKRGQGTVIDRKPPAKWGTIFKRQVTGKW